MAGRTHGYHLQSIPKGEVGCISKITEECLELSDAAVQGCKILVLCELADLPSLTPQSACR